MKTDFPCWLSPKDKAVAEALVSMGFWYCGKAEDFITYEEAMTKHHGWLIGGAYQEQLLEAVGDEALFVFDVADDEDFEGKFLQTKMTISRAISEWRKPIGQQLELPI
jgi:hypothetical protein